VAVNTVVIHRFPDKEINKLYILSFNINSVRARIHQVTAIVERYQPTVIGLQETKVHDDEFPLADLQALDYQVITHGQKGHYGVALLTRLPITKTIKGLPGDDDNAQRRLIGAHLQLNNSDELIVLNGYFPQGENIAHATKYPAKRAFYNNLQDLLERQYSPEDNLLVMGDMNISATDLDIGIGEDNRKRWLRNGKTSFQPEERQWMARLLGYGLYDSYREQHPDSTDYSWFDYRSKGFEQQPRRGLRIDQILLTSSLMNRCTESGIDLNIRTMEKPSDHCPIWIQINS
jgi:exodeoxyribonuclease-3